MTRVLVTGGSGLIGGALVERLVARGDEVVALARSDAAAESVARRGARPARGELFDPAALAAAADGCELAFHVAGINTLCPDDPAEMLRVNVDGAAAVARAAAAAGVRRLVHTSSAASIGEEHGTVGREDSPHRGGYLSVYERSKHESEGAVLDAARGTGLEVVLVCPASVQGPGRAGGTGKLLLAYLNGRLRVFVDTTISVVDIADAIEGHLLAAERGAPGERYLLCGAALEASRAFAIAGEIAGVHRRPLTVAPRLATVAATAVERGFRALGRTPPLCREMVTTMLHGHRYDGSRAARELGLRYTPVEETLRRTLAWARGAGLLRT